MRGETHGTRVCEPLEDLSAQGRPSSPTGPPGLSLPGQQTPPVSRGGHESGKGVEEGRRSPRARGWGSRETCLDGSNPVLLSGPGETPRAPPASVRTDPEVQPDGTGDPNYLRLSPKVSGELEGVVRRGQRESLGALTFLFWRVTCSAGLFRLDAPWKILKDYSGAGTEDPGPGHVSPYNQIQ